MHLYIILWVFKTSYKTSFIVYLQTERTQYTKFYFYFPVYCFLVGPNILVSYIHFKSLPNPYNFISYLIANV